MKQPIKNYLAGYNPEVHELYSKAECTRCYGRGYVGKNLTFDEYSQCPCLRMRLKPIDPSLEPVHDNMLSLHPPLVNLVEPIQSAPLSVVEPEELGGGEA